MRSVAGASGLDNDFGLGPGRYGVGKNYAVENGVAVSSYSLIGFINVFRLARLVRWVMNRAFLVRGDIK